MTVYPRARVTGTLTLQSPLALGDGGIAEADKSKAGEGEGGRATVAKTRKSLAAIPGSSLKGVLRGYLAGRVETAALNEIFGEESRPGSDARDQSSGGRGGKFEFRCCYSKQAPEFLSEISVAIDRVTRAAADRQLFAQELVPEGTSFAVDIRGFQVTEMELAVLLEGLNGFNAQTGTSVKLGSAAANDFGTAQWTLAEIAAMDSEAITSWLAAANGESSDYWSYAKAIQPSRLAPVAAPDADFVGIDVRLEFTGWFLSKDPQASKSKESKSLEKDSAPDAFPLLATSKWDQGRRVEGKWVMLRSSGFRGALRSQVERIARTLNGQAGGDPKRPGKSKIVEAVFGDAGHQAAVHCSRFVDERLMWDGSQGDDLPEQVKTGQWTPLLKREFVAIDRFTGGAADHLKFDAVAAWRPQLSGNVRIDLARLKKHCNAFGVPPAAAIGLLVLALRDLCDGDVSFGFGYGKGFGECDASILKFSTSSLDRVARLLGLADRVVDQHDQQRPDAENGDHFQGLDGSQRALLVRAVQETRDYFKNGMLTQHAGESR